MDKNPLTSKDISNGVPQLFRDILEEITVRVQEIKHQDSEPEDENPYKETTEGEFDDLVIEDADPLLQLDDEEDFFSKIKKQTKMAR